MKSKTPLHTNYFSSPKPPCTLKRLIDRSQKKIQGTSPPAPHAKYMIKKGVYTIHFLQFDREPLPYPRAINIEEQRGRAQRHAGEREHRDAPSITGVLEDGGREDGHDAADDGAKDGAGGDGRGGVFLEGIDVVVLHGVEDGDLAEAEEDGAQHGDGPVRAVLDRPREPEQRDGDEDGADVGQGEAVFGFAVVVVLAREVVVDGVDLGHEEPDADEEAEARAEVHEPDLGAREAVAGAVDGFEVGVQAVRRSEEDGLPDGHGQDDGLSE